MNFKWQKADQDVRYSQTVENALVFCAMDEFHHFARTNAWIDQVLRKRYNFIYAVAPFAATCVLSSADKVITDTLITKNLYPNLLKIMDTSRNVHAYQTTKLFEKVETYLKSVGIAVDMYMYTGTDTTNKELNRIFNNRVRLINTRGIPEDFGLIENMILEKKSILPYAEDVELVNKLNFANNKTVCILTRNFEVKQPFYNSKKKELSKFIKNAHHLGLNVINIGEPPLSFVRGKMVTKLTKNLCLTSPSSIKSNYLEISNLDYSKTLAIVNACAVWKIVPHAGAFSVHINSEANLIIEGPEFCKTDKGNYLFDVRKTCSDLRTYRNFSDFTKDYLSGVITSKIFRSRSRANHVIDLADVLNVR
jgi:hypothetical protein